MLKLLGKLPRQLTIACSGGVDSMVLLDFLKRNHAVTVAYFHHGTDHGEEAAKFVSDYCSKHNLSMFVSDITTAKLATQSQEEYWRSERYKFFETLGTVVTAHHLDDVAETWVWSCLHGTPSLLPYRRGNVIRPFLLNRKYDLEMWAKNKSVPFIQDMSNYDNKHMRNYIRNELMEKLLTVNAGLHTMLRKKIKSRIDCQ